MLDLRPHLFDVFAKLFILLLVCIDEPVKNKLLFEEDFMLMFDQLLVLIIKSVQLEANNLW